ncbi:gag-pol polyprotein [Cucumis melo var. makuwa]|uniref:Gag-pol polyprotein n=1 Tax=Cucumis melo var. makuwa TaxID=1194695 RepID=A0A5A7U5R6_CUCMM|nr:gag-pol polyprotein [Cucumis melo var. makuwa]TYK07822.1 gag-pol polyprotein [Cucumis melo var. makuwa]
MEIIREGPSASHPLVLDDKNYSYWKPEMIFFIKTLDGKAWRALVAGYDPPMITVNGVSISKPEVDWTNAEEQAFVGNARALNAIFNGVDLNVFKLIYSCSTAKEAWKTLEIAYEVSDYNKRVLEIANESLLLTHDITTLKLDELFGTLLTFEMVTADRESKKGKGITSKMVTADRESKKGKGIAFKSTHAECPTFLRRQKKNFRATLSDEDTSDGEEDNSINAFTVCISETDSKDESECSGEICDKNLTFEELKVQWKEDSEARAIQKERTQDLMEENERLMSVISSLKLKLKEVQCEYDQTLKSVKMLNSGTENLDVILNSGHNGLNKYGLGFDASARKINTTTEIKFVPALVNDKTDTSRQ